MFASTFSKILSRTQWKGRLFFGSLLILLGIFWSTVGYTFSLPQNISLSAHTGSVTYGGLSFQPVSATDGGITLIEIQNPTIQNPTNLPIKMNYGSDGVFVSGTTPEGITTTEIDTLSNAITANSATIAAENASALDRLQNIVDT